MDRLAVERVAAERRGQRRPGAWSRGDVEPSNRDEISIIKSPRSFASAVMFHRCLRVYSCTRCAYCGNTFTYTLSLDLPTLGCTLLLNPCSSSSHLRDRRRKALHALRDRIGLLVRKT